MVPYVPMVKVVLFDLGNVLVRIRANLREAVASVYRDCVALEVGTALDIKRERLYHRFGAGEIEYAYYLDQLVQELAPSLNELEKLDMTLVEWREILDKAHRAWVLDFYPFAPTLLEQLSKTGKGVACLSNTDPVHIGELQKQALSQFCFDLLNPILFSYELGASKPDALIYERAQSLLGCKAEEILFFDDKLANIEQAESLGWHCCMIKNVENPESEIRQALSDYGIL